MLRMSIQCLGGAAILYASPSLLCSFPCHCGSFHFGATPLPYLSEQDFAMPSHRYAMPIIAGANQVYSMPLHIYARLCHAFAFHRSSLPFRSNSPQCLSIAYPLNAVPLLFNACPVVAFPLLRCSSKGNAIPPRFFAELFLCVSPLVFAIPWRGWSGHIGAFAFLCLACPCHCLSSQFIAFAMLCCADLFRRRTNPIYANPIHRCAMLYYAFAVHHISNP